MNRRAWLLGLGVLAAALLAWLLLSGGEASRPLPHPPGSSVGTSPPLPGETPGGVARKSSLQISPAPAPTTATTVLEVSKVFQQGRDRFRTAAAVGRHDTGRFRRERGFGLTEARLLALIRPDEVLALAAGLATDPGAAPSDLAYGLSLLAFLHEEGHAGARDALLRLAYDSRPDVASRALKSLSAYDFEGRHRDLYRQRVGDGMEAALLMLTSWTDASLLTWAAAPERKSGPFRYAAPIAVEQWTLLASAGARDSRIRAELSTVGPRTELWTPWALRTAQACQVPGILEALRARLDQAELDAKAVYLDGIARSLPERMPPAFEEAYARDLLVSAFPDEFHDELLVTYWRLGGRLNGIESARCRNYGYACDPRERLAELMEPKK